MKRALFAVRLALIAMLLVTLSPPVPSRAAIKILSLPARGDNVINSGAPIRSTHYDGTYKAWVGFFSRPEFDASITMTIEAWIYRENPALPCEALVSHNHNYSFYLGLCAGLVFYRSGGLFATSPVTIGAHEWTHVAASYDGTRVWFYINGEFASSALLDHGGVGGDYSLFLGSDADGFNFAGYIDEVRLWSIARSEAQIHGGMYQQLRVANGLIATFGNGGDTEDLSGKVALAGTGTTETIYGILPRNLVVPRVPGYPLNPVPPIVDGIIDPDMEYKEAEQLVIRYSDGGRIREGRAYLLHDDDNLYIGVRPSGVTWADSDLSLFLDPTYSRHSLAQPSDVRLKIPLDGGIPIWLVGDGAGGYEPPENPPPMSSWDVATEGLLCHGNEFAPPCVEIRIARSLLGEWTEADGLALGHIDMDDPPGDFMAPSNALASSPESWPTVFYSDASAILPTARIEGGVYNVSSGTSQPISGHIVHLGSMSKWYYDRVTDANGRFSFDVPVPDNEALRLQADQCAMDITCHYEDPSFGSSGIPPISTSIAPLEVIFPRCPSGTCNYQDVYYHILLPVGVPAINSVSPSMAAPGVILRENPPEMSTPDQVELSGENLHPFIDIYLGSTLFPCGPLPPDQDCVFEAEILDRSPEMISATVRLPELTDPDPWGNAWRWLIRDSWGSPYWINEDEFTLSMPSYPTLYGFGFDNTGNLTNMHEFLAVYQENAYICLGILGLCLNYVPDPVYWLTWAQVFKAWIDSSGRSCVGMSATSQLIYNHDLSTDQFDEDVYFPAGFTSPGQPANWFYGGEGDVANPWPSPLDLWAEIRMNHGVQTSGEFISQVVLRHHAHGFSIEGDPVGRMEEIRDNPPEYVLCMNPDLGRGHCVTPYQVVDINDTTSQILTYDNAEFPGSDRIITIDREENTFNFQRPSKNEIWFGNAIHVVPLSVWRNERHMPLDIAEVVVSAVFGDADGLFTTPEGGQWGWKADGAPVDALPGAVALTPYGTSNSEEHNIAVALPTTGSAPTIQVNAQGGEYQFFAANGGQIFHLSASDALAEDADNVALAYQDKQISSFRFTPQRDASQFTPRIGVQYADRESAVFTWQDLSLEGGGTYGFESLKAERGVVFDNDSSQEANYTLFLYSVDGPSSTVSTFLFGPFEIPAGATQRITISNWPDGSQLLSEIDQDRDGSPDSSQVVPGKPCQPVDSDGDSAPDTCWSATLWLPAISH